MKKETLRIFQQVNPPNPRQDYDNLGTMAYKHSRYNLGEEQIGDPIEWLEEKLGLENAYIYNNERLEELESGFFDEFIALPLYLYDHSGITIRTYPFACRWDSGKVGYIYVSKQQARKEYSTNRITRKLKNKILDILMFEVQLYDQYLRGDVYGFVIENANQCHIDSCGGFFGTDWNGNGMKDHIPERLHSQLDTVEVNYDVY